MVHVKSFYPSIPEFPLTNLYDFCLKRRPADEPDYIFHIDSATGTQRSWHEFRARAAHAMTALGAPERSGGLGISREAGEIVGIVSPNALDYVTLFFALWGLTVPACPMSSYGTVVELQQLFQDAGITRLFVAPSHLAIALPAARAAGLRDDHIYLLEGSAPGRRSLGDMIDGVVARKIAPVQSRPVEKDTLAYLLFSSGTSGRPKAVMVSHTNLMTQLFQAALVQQVTDAAAASPVEPHPVSLGFLPLHHTFGLGYGVLRPTMKPMTLIMMPKWDVNAALQLIQKHKVTRLSSVPTGLIQILAAQRKSGGKIDLSSLKAVGSGAAYLPEEIRKDFAGILAPDAEVSQGYGMSECTMAATTTIPAGALGGRVKFVPGSLGLLLPNLEARTVREDGSEADYNEPGELFIRGPSIALGYWRKEKATSETFLPDGWLRSGDQFRVDEDGNFFFVDRLKDTLKISGMQVAPSEIEDTLIEHPDKLIVDVAVAGVSGGRTADEKVPRAWIILSDAGERLGKEAAVRVLDEHVRKTLSKYKHLRGGIEVTDAIPKSPTGKVLRRVLTEQYEAKKQTRAKL